MGVNIGATAIAGAYVGTTAVSKIYKGSTEIWSGSTPPTPTGTQYGKVYHYSSFSTNWSVTDSTDCYAEVQDPYMLESYASGKDYLKFVWEPIDQAWDDGGGFIYDLGSIGLYADAYSNDASFTVELSVTVDTTSQITSTDLLDSSEYNGLTDYVIYTIGGSSIPREAITSFEFGTQNVATPSSFLEGATNLTSVDFTYATGLLNINYGFLGDCTSLNSAIAVPNSVTLISGHFLAGCTSFNSALTLPSSLQTIGDAFMSTCTSFNQNITLPATLTTIGSSFMYNCKAMTSNVDVGSLAATIAAVSNNTFATNDSSAACYATGIAIAGTTASDWLTKFPDRSTSPYRRLHIGSGDDGGDEPGPDEPEPGPDESEQGPE